MGSEIEVRRYVYIPGDSPNEEHEVLIAFLPADIYEAFNNHCNEFNDSEVDYINKVLAEIGYSDEDIFFYMEADEYQEVYSNMPHEGDLLREAENGV